MSCANCSSINFIQKRIDDRIITVCDECGEEQPLRLPDVSNLFRIRNQQEAEQEKKLIEAADKKAIEKNPKRKGFLRVHWASEYFDEACAYAEKCGIDCNHPSFVDHVSKAINTWIMDEDIIRDLVWLEKNKKEMI